jgi:hypothetical protein
VGLLMANMLRKTLGWNLLGVSFLVPVNPLILVTPNFFSGEENAFTNFSAA